MCPQCRAARGVPTLLVPQFVGGGDERAAVAGAAIIIDEHINRRGGKTAVVEGFALRIVNGDVPPPLKGVRVRILDLSLLQAGAGVKGEFENRLKSVIQEVKASPVPIILFIDEAHTLIGAGGSAGQGDAANLLKPALARGTLRTVAATTWDEYKKHIEKDPALVRRFQVINIDEPDEKKAILMMRGVAASFEQ